jgi:hypothetical protein
MTMSGKEKIGKALPRAAIGFKPEYLDFGKGIRVGNLDDNQRITRILKLALEDTFQESFVTERFGRGVYWQWIGFLSRANRSAKPVSSGVSFGCSKFFITIDSGDRLFKCGFTVERGFLIPSPDFPQIGLKPDWDWNRLLKECRAGSTLYRELRRLVLREGFCIDAGNWEERNTFRKSNLPAPEKLRKIMQNAAPGSWAGFQIYYPMGPDDVSESSGLDLVEAMLAVFREVAPAMNQCMQINLVSG